MGDKTSFGKSMRSLMSIRYKLMQDQRKIWRTDSIGCDSRYTVHPDGKTYHYCNNRGHYDFRRTGVGGELKCSYTKCPFLKSIV